MIDHVEELEIGAESFDDMDAASAECALRSDAAIAADADLWELADD